MDEEINKYYLLPYLLQLPKHWMMYFFAAHAFVELKLSDQALEAYTALAAAGFHKSTYITAQMAIAHHDRRGKTYYKSSFWVTFLSLTL